MSYVYSTFSLLTDIKIVTNFYSSISNAAVGLHIYLLCTETLSPTAYVPGGGTVGQSLCIMKEDFWKLMKLQLQILGWTGPLMVLDLIFLIFCYFFLKKNEWKAKMNDANEI